MAKSRYYYGICLEGLRSTMETPDEDRQCPSQDSNRVPPQYKPRTLLLDQSAQ